MRNVERNAITGDYEILEVTDFGASIHGTFMNSEDAHVQERAVDAVELGALSGIDMEAADRAWEALRDVKPKQPADFR